MGPQFTTKRRTHNLTQNIRGINLMEYIQQNKQDTGGKAANGRLATTPKKPMMCIPTRWHRSVDIESIGT